MEIAKLSDCISSRRLGSQRAKINGQKRKAGGNVQEEELMDQIKDSDDYFDIIDCRDLIGGSPGSTSIQVKIITGTK